MIVLDHIAFGYTPENQIIHDLSADFEKGTFISIVGPNGSGKTTLLDLISGFLTPANGTITIAGKNIRDFSKQTLARQISLVSQDYAINFPFLVKDVVLMGRNPYIDRFSQPSVNDLDIAEQVIEQCGIAHLKNRKITELSGGERQRCVFARALCQQTPILLLDEAFSNMDIRHTLDMLKQVKESVHTKNTTVISVFHDLNIASVWSDTLMMLKQGKVAFSGPCQDILNAESIKSVFHVDGIVTENSNLQKKQVSYPSY